MKDILKSIVISFSMYSKIPMPYIQWNEKNMRYAMCFLPLIGVVIGTIVFVFYYAGMYIKISPVLFSSIATVLPIVINGGIHMDGFIDTIDAINSHQDIEKKLLIMKDVHVGAFAVIVCFAYFIVQFGFWYEIYEMPLKYFVISLSCFCLSRTMSGFLQISMKCARNSGLAYIFSENADKKNVLAIYFLWLILCISFLLFIEKIIAVFIIIGVFILTIWFRKMCYKNFGGITGDLCGYMLQIMELLIVAITVLGGKFICFL